jgi:hypothetical protein
MGKRTRLILPGHTNDHAVTLANQEAKWLDDVIRQSTPQRNSSNPYPLLRDMKTTFPGTSEEFEGFLGTTSWKKVHAAGLLLI